MEEQQNQDRTDFLKETIKQRPLNRKKLIRKTIITAAMAVIFGLVACLTFLLLEPVISNRLYPEEKPSTVVLVEEKESEEILPEDMIADDSEMSPEPVTPVLEDEQIAQVLSEMKLGVEDYTSLYDSLAAVAKSVQSSMVTVVGITSDVDWFNNVYKNEGSVAGVIIADNGKELLILTNYPAVEDAELLEITFSDELEYEAELKKKDSNTGLAVLAVEKNTMKRTTLQAAEPIKLGTSAGSNLIGNPVIALGQPAGVAGSVCYGFVTSAGSTVDLPDSRYKWITTDIYGSSSATGILVNLRGQVIGIIDSSHNSSDTRNLVSAIGITDLRKLIERMSNDKDIPYLGIHGADVTLQVHEELDVPYGAYIMEIDMDSPAMAAGIQSGDVVTGIGDTKVTSYQELINGMMDMEPEETMTLTLLRQGPEGYTEMELSVTLGTR